MKAIAITPGLPRTARLADPPMPGLEELPGRRGVLVRVRTRADLKPAQDSILKELD